MTDSRRSTRQTTSKLDAAVRALAEHVGRLVQSLSPQPQLQPIPVRTRDRDPRTRRG